MRLFSGLLVALSLGLTAAPPEDSDASLRLSRRGTAVLESLLGPGRGRVFVEARVEQVETRAEFEGGFAGDSNALPAALPEAMPAVPLPGYAEKASPPASRRTIYSDRGELIRALRVGVFVDSSLAEDKVQAALKVLGESLGLDISRGDKIDLVRVPERNSWKEAFSSPEARRQALLVLGASLLAAFGLLALARSLRSSARFLADAVRRPSPAVQAGPKRSVRPLPALEKSLGPGGGLSGADAGDGGTP